MGNYYSESAMGGDMLIDYMRGKIAKLEAENAALRANSLVQEHIITAGRNPEDKDKIVKLIMENAALREAQRWIPVSEELPEQDEKVSDIYDAQTLAVIDAEHHMVSDLVVVAVKGEDGKTFVCDDILVDGKWSVFPFPEWEVTHWMSMPQAPKGGAD